MLATDTYTVEHPAIGRIEIEDTSPRAAAETVALTRQIPGVGPVALRVWPALAPERVARVYEVARPARVACSPSSR